MDRTCCWWTQPLCWPCSYHWPRGKGGDILVAGNDTDLLCTCDQEFPFLKCSLCFGEWGDGPVEPHDAQVSAHELTARVLGADCMCLCSWGSCVLLWSLYLFSNMDLFICVGVGEWGGGTDRHRGFLLIIRCTRQKRRWKRNYVWVTSRLLWLSHLTAAVVSKDVSGVLFLVQCLLGFFFPP